MRIGKCQYYTQKDKRSKMMSSVDGETQKMEQGPKWGKESQKSNGEGLEYVMGMDGWVSR